jgi:hypothetical protein
MNVNSVEISKLKLSRTADVILYSLPDNDIKAIIKQVKAFVKQLIDGKASNDGQLYQFSYKKVVVLLRAHSEYLEVMDIVNNQVYRPHEGFRPQVLSS